MIGIPCINSSDIYAIHMTPWTEPKAWAGVVRTLHENITRGGCIGGFL
jgi:hypothetical protein